MDHQINKLLQILISEKIDFVIVGGFGALLHGSSQVTKDLDVCLSFSFEVIEKLRKALADFQPVHRMTPQRLSFLEHPRETKGLKNLYLQTDVGMLDLLGEIGGVGNFEEVKKRAVTVELFGKKFQLISIEDLIKAKYFMGRPKDLATIKELECIKESKIK